MKLKKKVVEMQSAKKTKQCRMYYKNKISIVTVDLRQIIKHLTSSYENIELPQFKSQELGDEQEHDYRFSLFLLLTTLFQMSINKY